MTFNDAFNLWLGKTAVDAAVTGIVLIAFGCVCALYFFFHK